MKCDACGEKEATVFLTQVVSGKVVKASLCEACSKAKGINDPVGFALSDMLLGLDANKISAEENTKLQCPVCSFTLVDLKKTGRLGCSHCYEVFSDKLAGMIKKMHKGTQHIGKTPRSKKEEPALPSAQTPNPVIAELHDQLNKAIDNEDYERAAELRDKIRALC